MTLNPYPVPSVAGMARTRIWVKGKNLEDARRLVAAAEDQHFFCSDCYAVVLPDEKVCPNCGADLED